MHNRRLLAVIDEFPTRILAVTLAALAVISTGYIWWSVDRFGDFTQCQAEWSGDLVDYAESSNEAEAGERSVNRFEQEAFNRLVDDLINLKIEEERAVERWQESRQLANERRADLQQDRARNPLPEPPLEVCNGGAGEGDIAD